MEAIINKVITFVDQLRIASNFDVHYSNGHNNSSQLPKPTPSRSSVQANSPSAHICQPRIHPLALASSMARAVHFIVTLRAHSFVETAVKLLAMERAWAFIVSHALSTSCHSPSHTDSPQFCTSTIHLKTSSPLSFSTSSTFISHGRQDVHLPW